MRLADSSSEQRFRAAAREFISTRAPDLPRRVGEREPESAGELRQLKEWGRELIEHGFLGGAWPPSWGGRGERHDPGQDVIVAEEMARLAAPNPPGINHLAAHAILHFSSESQRALWAPRFRAYEDVWAQGFSEPEAGSDLASLRTRAVSVDGGYAISGQKIWTTYASCADYLLLLARTDPNAPRHAGISCFALDLRTPGVEVRPIREITGTSDFGEVFLDDVRVGEEALIGAPGEGWRVAIGTLAAERTGLVGAQVALEASVRELAAAAGPGATARIGRRFAAARAATLVGVLNRNRDQRGLRGADAAPVEKVLFSESYVELGELLAELSLGDPGLDRAGTRWLETYLYGRAYTISGGSNQVMRDVIAERGLGMPRYSSNQPPSEKTV